MNNVRFDFRLCVTHRNCWPLMCCCLLLLSFAARAEGMPQATLPVPDLYWQFDASGQANFSITDAYDASVDIQTKGGMLLTEGVRETPAFLFDGVGAAFHVAGNLMSTNQDLSIAAWVRPELLAPDGWHSVVEIAGEKRSGSHAAPQAGIAITRLFDGKIALFHNHTRYLWPLPYNPGRWMHLAAVFMASGEVKLYVNALPQGEPSATAYQMPAAMESTAFIGRSVAVSTNESAQAQYFRGAIDHFFVYTRRIPEDFVEILYGIARPPAFTDHFTAPGFPQPYWDMRPATGFGVHSGVLHATGFHGPNHLGATSPFPDKEFSLWHRYNDLRYRKDIPEDEQQLDLTLRQSLCGSMQIALRITPHAVSFIHASKDREKVLAVSATPDFEPNTWYNTRVRIVGKECAVWLRDAEGHWGDAFLTHTLEVADFSTASFTLTIHPGADYQIDNFHVRPFQGNILENIDALDTVQLHTSANRENSGTIIPQGGLYPPDETVHLWIETAPGFFFNRWDEENNSDFYNILGSQTRLSLDGDKSVTALMRKSYNLPDAIYGQTHYDSNYAPHGYTNLDFSGLVSKYEDASGFVHRFMPAKVVLQVKDFPADDPLRSLHLSEIEQVIDDDGQPIYYPYPVGATVHIQAYPLGNMMGFPNILMGWETEPGTAINQAPSPEEEHRFTVTPLDAAAAIQFRLHAGMVGAEVEIPAYVRFRQTSGHHSLVNKAVKDGVLTHTYHVFGPLGACQEMSAMTLQFKHAYVGPLGLGNYDDLPRHGVSYRLIPLELHGSVGDARFLYKNWLIHDTCWAPIDGNPSEALRLANPALSPGKGLIKTSLNTPIIGGQ